MVSFINTSSLSAKHLVVDQSYAFTLYHSPRMLLYRNFLWSLTPNEFLLEVATVLLDVFRVKFKAIQINVDLFCDVLFLVFFFVLLFDQEIACFSESSYLQSI